jgi:cytochrome P450
MRSTAPGKATVRVATALFSPQARIDPYPGYSLLREVDPVHFDPHIGMWFLTRHADCLAVLRDRRFSAELGQRLRRRDEGLPPSMLTSDPPEHARLRRPAAEAFTASSARSLRPRIEQLAHELLEPLAEAREVDLISEYARVLPMRLLAELLGVGREEFAGFRDHTYESAQNLDPLAPHDEQRRATEAAAALADDVRGLLSRSRDSGASALLETLLRARDRGDVSTEEVVGMCTLFVIGGHEPLASLIANGVLALLRRPAELVRFREDRSVDATAIEELLRFDSPIQFAARVATVDVEVGGRTVRRGQPVLTLLGAANRDPAVLEDPDRLDLERRPNPHLAFGAGVHLCLGAPLTRVAGAVALRALVERFPRLELATDRVEWRRSLVPRAPASLPVRL